MRLLRPSFRKILVALLLMALPWSVYLRASKHPPESFAWYERVSLAVVSPFLRGIHWWEDLILNLGHHTIFLLHTERENEILRAQLSDAKLKEGFFNSLRAENERLTRLIGVQQRLPYLTLVAKVLSVPPLGEFRLLVVDRGEADGVVRGAAVLTPDGLVGRILRVEKNSAQVLRIDDPTSAVDARIERTGARGLVVGLETDLGLDRRLFLGAMEYWDRNQEVADGDQVVTSGLDHAFPPDLVIGKATAVRKGSYEVFLEGKIIPAVDFNKLREVLIVKPR